MMLVNASVKSKPLSCNHCYSCVSYLDLSVTIKSIAGLEYIYTSKKHNYSPKRVVTVSDDTGDSNVLFWGDLVSKRTHAGFNSAYCILFFV